jgi:hypothetical protein
MDSDEEESSDEEIKEIPIGGANKRRKGADSQDESDSMMGYGEEGEDSMYGDEDEDDKKLKAKRNKDKKKEGDSDDDELDYGSDDSMDSGADFDAEDKKRE